MNFRESLKKDSPIDEFEKLEMRMQFAQLCLDGKPDNEAIYNALSHLALIPGLNIDLACYDDLKLPPTSHKFDTEAYDYARKQLFAASDIYMEELGRLRYETV